MKHFRDILELRDFLYHTDCKSTESALRAQLYPGWYTWVISSRAHGKAGKIVPIDLGRFLYRGQTEVHKPCIPNIYRQHTNEDKKIHLDEFISLLKLSEFRLLCLTHPGVKRCVEFGLDIEFIGLAQHYGLDTRYIDLTQNIDIACFFATCKNDNGNYFPFSGEGQGVVYRISHSHPDILPYTVLIGKQPFRRPEVQKAWAIEMHYLEDLEKFNGIEIFIFNHSPEASQAIYNLFENQLFPEDLIARKAIEIKESLTIYKGIFNYKFEKFIYEYSHGSLTIKRFIEEIDSQNKYKLSDNPSAIFTTDELQSESDKWKEYGELFLHKVGALFCSDSKR